jgi:hypothetical protein
MDKRTTSRVQLMLARDTVVSYLPNLEAICITSLRETWMKDVGF